MHYDKSPGLDEMSRGFYQRYRGIAGGDII